MPRLSHDNTINALFTPEQMPSQNLGCQLGCHQPETGQGHQREKNERRCGQKQIIGFTWLLIYGMELVGMGWSLKIPWTLLLLSKDSRKD